MARIRLIAVLAALVALATGIAACGGGGGDDSGADAQEVLASASLEGIESARFDLEVDFSAPESSDATVAASGAFQKEAGSDLPTLAVTVDASEEGDRFEGGLTLLTDRAYVNFEGTEYEVDPTTFGFVRSSLEQAQQQSPEEEGGDITACQEAVEGVELERVFQNLENEGSADVEGQETTRIGGRFEPAAIVDLLIELAEDPACAAATSAAGGGSVEELREQRDEISRLVEQGEGSVYVGEDGVVRRATLDLQAKDADGEDVEVAFDLTLSEVNEDQEIAAPSGAEPLEKLFQQLDVNPLELLEGGEGGITGLLDELLEGEGLSPGGGSLGGGGGGGEGGSAGSGGEGSGSDSGGEGSGGAPDPDRQQAYLECLKEVETASDLQDCAGLAP